MSRLVGRFDLKSAMWGNELETFLALYALGEPTSPLFSRASLLILENFDEKKSLAVATGELFLGIASRFLRNKGGEFLNGGEGRGVPADPVQPEVVWEQRVKDVEAERRRKVVSSPGFSFSAAGLLFPYHLGVAQLLIEKGYIKTGNYTACWFVCGAIVCAAIASGTSMQEALKATKMLAEDCRFRGTAFRIGASNNVQSIMCRWGLTLFMPPTSAAETVRVCAFPASRLGLQGIGISPDCNPENRASPRDLFNWALEPAADDILDKLFELGYLDAAVWAKENPVERTVKL
ncbi:hypothetical protein DH2020_011198 [Rehmannia glutinosa]|uniref:MmgE/PrpD family protein n=1 Tax=Rehmannia glutinosa TaxID=99300 RepID=A0ABR0XCX5_REHGL